MSAPAAAAAEQCAAARDLVIEWQDLRLARDSRTPALNRALARKVAEEKRWVIGIGALSNRWADELLRHADEAIRYALSSWKQVAKASGDNSGNNGNQQQPPPAGSQVPWLPSGGHGDQPLTPPDAEEVKRRLVTGVNRESMVQGGVTEYLGLAGETSTLSGQAALEKLGLNKTFAWAHPQNMARDMFQVRGSKVIQGMYGNHLNDLTKLILEATDPRHPKTLDEVRKAISEKWPGLRAWQVDRIARTETAAVWTATSVAAYQANGIDSFESIVATGPSINVDTNGACDMCVEAASTGPFQIGSSDLPPWHPCCRCEALPVLEDPETGEPWLPPDEPWTGQDLTVAPRPLGEVGNVLPYPQPMLSERWPPIAPAPEPVPTPRRIDRPDDVQDLRREAAALRVEGSGDAERLIQTAIKSYSGEANERLYVLRDSEGKLRGAYSYVIGTARGTVGDGAIGSTLQGGGTALMRQAARDAVQHNLPLDVAPAGHGVQEFYEKLGFQRANAGFWRLEGEPLERLAARTGEADAVAAVTTPVTPASSSGIRVRHWNDPMEVGNALHSLGEDTLVDVPAHTVYVGSHEYQFTGGKAWLHGWTIVKVEDMPNVDLSVLQRRVNALIDKVPEDVRKLAFEREKNLDMVTVAAGHSPSDPYYQEKYGKQFTVAAQGGDQQGTGQMWMWNGVANLDDSTFFHEYGHVIGKDGGPLKELKWAAAQQRDRQFALERGDTKLGVTYTSSGGTASMTTGTYGVTRYGAENRSEDWAESVAFYLSRDRTITSAFETKFPNRARLLNEWLHGVKAEGESAAAEASGQLKTLLGRDAEAVIPRGEGFEIVEPPHGRNVTVKYGKKTVAKVFSSGGELRFEITDAAALKLPLHLRVAWTEGAKGYRNLWLNPWKDPTNAAGTVRDSLRTLAGLTVKTSGRIGHEMRLAQLRKRLRIR